ncbi:sugar ABC transporter ATP-binding protein [Bradyrhizobium diazoefficiens]|uniref:ATP-binding cassette domain-containing protein n=1 Tax=Bradyrhizobium diazoefficiens TaxID=1355477 RepID=UPI00190D0F85|nr:ATP-binding cassette domain-containing protein [Bradyrhizobium diazoefficiens]MBK3661013.1 sugar ABC transporter ATP-binding protein [Bradyrhizobium diazoefficiens]
MYDPTSEFGIEAGEKHNGEDLGFNLDPNHLVGRLSRTHQQMVEIAKALLVEPRILILDEPTASLTEREAGWLFELVATLKARGVGIIYVSHGMQEIRALADRRHRPADGQLVRTLEAAGAWDSDLVELVTGRKIDGLFPKFDQQLGRVAMEVAGLSTWRCGPRRKLRSPVRFKITGIAGLIGCGKSKPVRAIYGPEDIERGAIRRQDQSPSTLSPRQRRRRCVADSPANRVTADGCSRRAPRSCGCPPNWRRCWRYRATADGAGSLLYAIGGNAEAPAVSDANARVESLWNHIIHLDK